MIKVNVTLHNNIINQVAITGHAKFDVYGKDIICASVSSIVITTINAILSLDEEAINYEEKKNKLNIKIINDNQIAIKIINNMLKMLEEIHFDYPKNIVIRNEE